MLRWSKNVIFPKDFTLPFKHLNFPLTNTLWQKWKKSFYSREKLKNVYVWQYKFGHYISQELRA